MSNDIWTLVQYREGGVEEVTFGLLGEGRWLLSQMGGEGKITAVALGLRAQTDLEKLGVYGADKVLHVPGKSLAHYRGELFARVLSDLARSHHPSCILMAHNSETADLSPRLAAILETGLVTRAVDFRLSEKEGFMAIRPVANGHLFEAVHFDCPGPPIVSFLPSVLSAPEPELKREVEIVTEPFDVALNDLEIKVVQVIEAVPEELDLEEADIIVSGGRGVGKGEAFNIIHELAKTIGGSVAGTRPIIDLQSLPFDRQIGQTGKTVAPRLIFTCGISGANEFTAGMEKAHLVIAINTDPRARIFRFADLGVIGDVHEVIPILVERIKEIKGQRE
jgi:electron transfer flavoprotein alpha subunit